MHTPSLTHFPPFVPHLLSLFPFLPQVLDFNHLHQLSDLLSEAGLASDNAFTIRESFSTSPGHKSLAEVQNLQYLTDKPQMVCHKHTIDVDLACSRTTGGSAFWTCTNFVEPVFSRFCKIKSLQKFQRIYIR